MSSQTLLNGKSPGKKELLELLDSKEILRGKTPFSTMLISNGKIPFWSLHKKRLKLSFEYLFKENEFSNMEKLLDQAKEVGESKGASSKVIRLTMIPFNNEVKLLTQIEDHSPKDKDSIKLKTSKHPLRSSSLPKFLKNGNYLEISLEVEKAKEAGADDCLFIDNNEFASECSTSNIFFRKGSRFFTPSLEGPVLEGITRSIVLEIMKDLGQEAQELNISRSEWENMDEAFITNSLKGLVSVNEIDGRGFSKESDFLTQIKKEYKRKLG